ncbi:MAG: (d)CMP kinase, partial [Chloroflexota bacterium]|nr:(d)CMP kinase [Chloroflexota bacterium]
GPAASGKTAVGRAVSRTLKWKFLDTGIMYRAATRSVLDLGVSLENDSQIIEVVKKTSIDLDDSSDSERILINGKDKTDTLKTPEIDRVVSIISKIPDVRKELVNQQRTIAKRGPIVMVGRDIGSVVLPDAHVRLYLDANVEIRAERRYREQVLTKPKLSLEQIKMDLDNRDRIDRERDDSPLEIHDFYVVIETSSMTLSEVITKVTDICQSTF